MRMEEKRKLSVYVLHLKKKNKKKKERQKWKSATKDANRKKITLWNNESESANQYVARSNGRLKYRDEEGKKQKKRKEKPEAK